MLGTSVIGALFCKTLSLPSCVRLVHTASVLRSSQQFDTKLLQFLVCPLSRKALRYDESTNELVNDDLGIAYPIVDGIPNMIPQDAKKIQKEQKPESDQESH